MNLDPGEGCGRKRSGSTLPFDKVFPLEVYFSGNLSVMGFFWIILYLYCLFKCN